MQKFYWLDDNPERATSALLMEAEMKVSVEFINLKETNLEERIATLLESEQSSLIILDHNLEDANRGVFKKGSTAAAFIRETWPDCPIICVTNEDIHHFNSLQKSLYEEIFSFLKISSNYDSIRAIADSFDVVKENKPKTSNEIISLLNAPEIDSFKLSTVLPTILKENLKDNGLAVELSRWIRGTLIKRPGFLYNRLWVSTLIGIKEESFEKVAHHFDYAKYNGLFANDGDPRWWKSSVLEVLYDISDAKGFPWQRGRGITDITPDDYSKCFSSDEYFPETVAFIDQGVEPKEVPIKIKYTKLHPDYESMLHFEDVRLMNTPE